jgi:hypothetical protein
MKYKLGLDSIVGLNETNSGARETFFAVIKETPGTSKYIAQAPTRVQAQKMMANAQRERMAQVKNSPSHHPLTGSVFGIVKVKRYGHHDGQKMVQVYAEEETLLPEYRVA